jgi:hypothetical protein
MPYGCAPPCRTSLGLGSLYVGYLFSDKQGLKFTREVTTAIDEPNIVYKFPVQGILLGLSGTFWAGESLGVIGSGALLIPVKTNGNTEEEGPGATALGSSLDANNQFGFLDAAASYKFYDAGWASFHALAGFRWDHFTSKQTFVATDAGATFVRDTTNNLTVDAYVPYFGVKLAQMTPCSYFNARVIGFPTVPGNITFQNSFSGTENLAPLVGGGDFHSAFKNGYFIEVFGEYAAKMLGDVFVGGFGAYDILQGKTGEGQYTASGGGALDEQIVLTRRTWTLGGTLGYQF